MDNNRKTKRINDTSEAIDICDQETVSRTDNRKIEEQQDYSTCGSAEITEPLKGEWKANILRQLEKMIPQINNLILKEQLEMLIYSMIIVLDSIQENIEEVPIPQLKVKKAEENSVIAEWNFPDLRAGFNIESDPNSSGAYLVLGERLGDTFYSKSMRNAQEIKEAVNFIIKSILNNI